MAWSTTVYFPLFPLFPSFLCILLCFRTIVEAFSVLFFFVLQGMACCCCPRGMEHAYDQAGVCKIAVTRDEDRKLQHDMASVLLVDHRRCLQRFRVTQDFVFIYILCWRVQQEHWARMVIWFRGQVRQAIIVFHSSPMYVNSSLERPGASWLKYSTNTPLFVPL